MQLLCRNRVTDFDTWWAVFESNTDAGKAAGLHLQDLWVNADDPNEVFFIFEVDDRAKAVAFMNAPEAAESAEESGVIDGDCWFVLEAEGY